MDERIKRSREQEQRIAKRFEGSVTPRSGAGWIKKGDVRTATELFEAKTTAAKSFSLKKEDLMTAIRHALLAGKRMCFAVEIDGYDFVVLDEDDYIALTRKAGER
jgi:hypothetical protein